MRLKKIWGWVKSFEEAKNVKKKHNATFVLFCFRVDTNTNKTGKINLTKEKYSF